MKPVACKDCTDRYVGCHSSCSKYADYVQQLYALKQQIHREKKKDSDYYDYKEKAKRKARRKTNRK